MGEEYPVASLAQHGAGQGGVGMELEETPGPCHPGGDLQAIGDGAGGVGYLSDGDSHFQVPGLESGLIADSRRARELGGR